MNILLVNPPVIVIDKIQAYAYPDMIPFGLLQISSFLKSRGDDVRLFDFFTEEENRTTHPYGKSKMGKDGVIETDTYYYGEDFSVFSAFLSGASFFDEIWITCSIGYNYPLVRDLIKICRDKSPDSVIVLGGNYPTIDPDHAMGLKPDRIFVNRIAEADMLAPDYSIVERKFDYCIFKLSTGCTNKCSFCVNGLEKLCFYDIDFVISYLKELKSRYHPRYFSNWDPNIMLFKSKMKEFLIAYKKEIDVPLRLEMGLQPNILDRDFIKLMKESGVETITIPFDLGTKQNKPYSVISSMKALALMSKHDFNKQECHCTYVIGYPDDDLDMIFLIFSSIRRFGGNPMCFPLTLVKKSGDYEKYSDIVKNKDLTELNGHLWPLLPTDKLELYRNLLFFLNSRTHEELMENVKLLPNELRLRFVLSWTRSKEFIRLCLEASDTTDNLNSIIDKINKIN